PSFAFDESACRSASARTFLGKPMAWLRTTGPKERPPPRNCGALCAPWRAPPVPFWAYIFLVVRLTSPRSLVLCVPRWRLASCQLTQRWIRSTRGSSPKISFDSVALPLSLPSRARTLSSITRPLCWMFLWRRRQPCQPLWRLDRQLWPPARRPWRLAGRRQQPDRPLYRRRACRRILARLWPRRPP